MKKWRNDDCRPIAISRPNTASMSLNLMIRLNSLNVCFICQCPVCQDALGMESGAISNGQVRASTEWDANHAAIQARLNFKAVRGKAGSWSARHNNLGQWLQIDLGNKHTKVTGLATQGRNGYHQWVTKYKVQYSDDGVNFQYYTEQGQVGSKVKSFSTWAQTDT